MKSVKINLPTLIKKYFSEYLPLQRSCSPNTISAYSRTFTLFLKYLQKHYNRRPDHVEMDDLSARNVIDFLNDLQKTRGNANSTRNARLAAIHSFAKYLLIEYPILSGNLQQVLAIPVKKTKKRMLDFLTQEEIDAILASPSDKSWCGRRNRVLLEVMYNTGARVSEILELKVADVRLEPTGMVHLTGKGRKERTVPLWKDTVKLLRKWIQSNRYSPDSLLFPNNRGGKMTRSAIAKMLTSVVETTKDQCPTLKSRKISPHTLRHTTAMHLLQSGVDITVIAMWLGHESIETTHTYITTDTAIKEKALQEMQPPKTKNMRFRPKGSLLEFLENQ